MCCVHPFPCQRTLCSIDTQHLLSKCLIFRKLGVYCDWFSLNCCLIWIFNTFWCCAERWWGLFGCSPAFPPSPVWNGVCFANTSAGVCLTAAVLDPAYVVILYEGVLLWFWHLLLKSEVTALKSVVTRKEGMESLFMQEITQVTEGDCSFFWIHVGLMLLFFCCGWSG